VAKDNTANARAYELLLRGKENFNKGELEVARQLFREAIRLDERFADAYAWLSLGLNEQFDSGRGDRSTLDAAIAHANKALEIDPDLIMARRALITIYRNIGQTEEGLKQAKLVLTANPDDYDAIFAAAHAYFETGILDRAIQLYQKAIVLDPNAAISRQRLARCYLHTGEYQKGLDVLAPLLAQQRGGEWMAMTLYGRLRHYDRAIEMGQRLLKNEGEGMGPLLSYGDFGKTLKQAGRAEQARAAWLEGARLGEAQLAAIENVRSRIWLGHIYAELEERERALAQVKRANTIEPDNAWVLYQSGDINAKLGNKREAVAYLKQAVARGFRELQYFSYLLDDRLGGDPEYLAVRDGLQKRVDELRRLY
jgi:tetratricopeptide (TPR) repeat protein